MCGPEERKRLPEVGDVGHLLAGGGVEGGKGKDKRRRWREGKDERRGGGRGRMRGGVEGGKGKDERRRWREGRGRMRGGGGGREGEG